MIRIDSLKIKASAECLKSVNESLFENFERSIEGEITQEKQVLSPKKVRELGLKNIEVDTKKDLLILELSSKVLHSRYYDMINLETVEETFNNVKKCNIIDFDTNKFIDSSEVLRCDITNNLRVSRDVQRVIGEQRIFRINNNYACNPYPETNSVFKNGVVFKRRVKSNRHKETLTMYDKFKELSRNNVENRVLLKHTKLEDFRGVLRVESRFANFEQMRKNFNVSGLSLLEVLNSNENVNAKLYEKITTLENIEFEVIKNYKILFDMSSQMSDSKIKKTLGELQVLSLCNNDIELVKLYLQENRIQNKARALRRYREVLKKVNEFDTGELEMDKSVNEIKTLLRVA